LDPKVLALSHEVGFDLVDSERGFKGLRVRIGLHCGEPMAQADPTTGRMDYFGPMVNRAARVEGHAAGGQVLVSASVHGVAGLGSLKGGGRGLDVKDLGEFELKGIAGKERLFQVLPERLAHRRFGLGLIAGRQNDPLPAQAQPNAAALDALDTWAGRGGPHPLLASLASEATAWWRVPVARNSRNMRTARVSVRAEPRGDSDELGALNQGDEVAALPGPQQRKGDWLYVAFELPPDTVTAGARVGSEENPEEGGAEGGLSAEYLEGWVLSRLERGGGVDLLEPLPDQEQAARHRQAKERWERAAAALHESSKGSPTRRPSVASVARAVAPATPEAEASPEPRSPKSSGSPGGYRRGSGGTGGSGGGGGEEEDGDEDEWSMTDSEFERLQASGESSELSDSEARRLLREQHDPDLVRWPQYFVVVSGPLHLASSCGVGGKLVAELNAGEIVKAIGSNGAWMEIEIRQGPKGATGFLAKSKGNARSIVRVADDDAEAQWEDQ